MDNLRLRLYELYVLFIYIICYIFCAIFNIKKDTWLICERGTDARDNGYVFYKYMKKEYPQEDIKYIISKKSADRKKIQEQDIINYRSFKHYIYFIASRYLISTHVMGFAPETRLFVKMDMYNLVKVRGKKIFLQHGIIYNEDYSKNQKQRFNIDLFICGAEPEHKFLKEISYFDDTVLKYTGLARYDNYKNIEKKNYILIMPTWRYHLSKINDFNKFKESNYFKSWNSLLNNEELIKKLEEKNTKIIFYPHYEFQRFVSAFSSCSDNVIIADFKHYDVNDLLRGCNMLITDFSSVFFDIHYMKKPVLYYQFDYEEFRKLHHQTGWYDFIDGFGLKCEDEVKAVQYIIEKIDNGYIVEKEYIERINKCFIYNDTNNCKRIYNEIINLK